MSTPTETPWATLDAGQKHARVLEVAGELYAREGIEASMPALAEALGVGVGSIYRQVGRKEDIVAALLLDHLRRVAARMEDGLGHDDAWEGLRDVVCTIVEEAAGDGLARELWSVGFAHPAVAAERPRVTRALEGLVSRAHAQGALRPDVTVDDVRLVCGTGKRSDVEPGSAARLAEFALRGMRPDCS